MNNVRKQSPPESLLRPLRPLKQCLKRLLYIVNLVIITLSFKIDPVNQRCSLQVRCRNGAREEICYVKGSVESVLESCWYYQGREWSPLDMNEKERRRILDVARSLGMKGRRYCSTCVTGFGPASAKFRGDCEFILVSGVCTPYANRCVDELVLSSLFLFSFS